MSAFLLAVAILSEWLCLLGLLIMRNPFDRLHAIAPANILPPILIVAAVVSAEGFTARTAKIIFIALVLIVSGPALTHVLARAARIHEKGGLRPNE